MKKKTSLQVQGILVNVIQKDQKDYISLTDIAKYKNKKTDMLIQNWMRNRNTLEYLGLREIINNPNFKHLEFEGFKKDAGLNAFLMSPSKWVQATDAIGIFSKPGKYGGTYAHKDVAIKFANWLSVEFELYLIKEFQRLKEQENQALDRNIKRFLTKMNYHIHTDAIKDHLIPPQLTRDEINQIYASEADVLNKALFGITAKIRKLQNPEKIGNMRDYASIEQLIILANIESMNAKFIDLGLVQSQRLELLNQTAITQMNSLLKNKDKSAFLGLSPDMN